MYLINKKAQQGISLFFALIALSILVSISLGLSSFLFRQIKLSREAEESIIAFYAADTGMERVLLNPEAFYSGFLPNNASFSVNIVCAHDFATCPSTFTTDPNCEAPRFCIKSKGVFERTQRMLQVKY